MPIYEFQCPTCDSTKEVVQDFDTEAPVCVICSVLMRRLISSPSRIKMGIVPLRYQRLGIKPPQSWEPGPGEA